MTHEEHEYIRKLLIDADLPDNMHDTIARAVSHGLGTPREIITALRSVLNGYRCPLRSCCGECWSYRPESPEAATHRLALALQTLADHFRERVTPPLERLAAWMIGWRNDGDQ